MQDCNEQLWNSISDKQSVYLKWIETFKEEKLEKKMKDGMWKDHYPEFSHFVSSELHLVVFHSM